MLVNKLICRENLDLNADFNPTEGLSDTRSVGTAPWGSLCFQ